MSASIRRAIEAKLRARIERDVSLGTLRGDPKALAGLVIAVVQGMSTLARDGAPRSKLLAIADAAMLAWPAGTEGA